MTVGVSGGGGGGGGGGLGLRSGKGWLRELYRP